METVEEQNQPKRISLKRSKIEETQKEEEGEDRISALHDNLIIHILSLLPSTKDSIRTSILSKRWRSLWTLVPILVFKQDGNSQPTNEFVYSVTQTLRQCLYTKLNKFEISMENDSRFESEVNSWIFYAVLCEVKELNISVSNFICDEFRFDGEFFINESFTDLRLRGFMLNTVEEVNWKNLGKLCLSHIELDEYLIETILSGSPVLKTLVLDSCNGYRSLDITSESVKNLVLSGYNDPVDDGNLSDVIEINAPSILSLQILYDLLLWKISLLNVSSLVEAKLDYIKRGYWVTTRKEGEEEMFKGFTHSLRHVKEIKVGVLCSKVVSRLEAKGFVFPPNMKFPDPTSPPDFDTGFLDDDDSDDSDSGENGPLVDHGFNGGEVI